MVSNPKETLMMTLNELLDCVEGDTFREICQSICGCLREDSRYDWVGIYWLKGNELTLGPWSGRKATEHTRIPVSEGICGAAVREEKTIIVDDVQKDPRYLACFLETRSEIVTPIFRKGKIIGEIDVDGKEIGAFTDEDRRFLEALAAHIGEQWPGRW
jgi:L-methionine (R)-S-oxide reductase